jgi:hypothetical protein
MAYREFTDARGVVWQAWEVIPATAERRTSGERRFGARDREDRRVRREQKRVRMDHGMAQGWLVFESALEKRRVYPIPDGWSRRTDEELVALLQSGTVA